MPRKTKDTESTDKEVKTTKKATSTTKKKVTTKKAASTTKKKATTKKAASSTKKKATIKKAASSTKTKTATKKAASTTKKKTTKKAAEKKPAKKATKTTTAKKATQITKKKTTTKKAVKKVDVVEYYDLPYRYNQTIVKVLAQTPTNLFIYWDISDKDRENYEKTYGDNFFETTKPILKIYNDTMNYSFEVEINDFANSWYLHVNDSKCDYRVELGRRPIETQSRINQDYIYISSSNEIESPNDKILFDKLQHMVYFRNVKTNSTFGKSIASLAFLRNMGKIYNIYDLYKQIYKDEDINDINNPSSRFF